MALTELTKVTGPGIHTLSNVLSHNIKSSGIITATKFSGPLDSIGGNFAGVITATNGVFSGNVTIGGTLTYEDVTNIDSVGIITAQKDIHVGAGVSAIGVGTFSGLDISGDIDVDGHTNLDNVSIAGVTTHADNASVKFGTDGDFSINHSGSSLGMLNTTGDTLFRNTGGSQYFDCNQISLRIAAGSQTMLNAAPGGVTLYTSNSSKLATTNTGVSLPQDLDVDGHTNLDNVSVAGISTFSGIVAAGIGSTAITLSNSHKITLGSAHELEMHHDGSNSYIKQRFFAYPSRLKIISENSGIDIMSGSGGGAHGGYENAITCENNGTVKLYYGGAPHLETYGGGVIFQGSIQVGQDIFHHGDTNTKIGFPAADTISAETAGNERLRITNTGNVLIGTTSGTEKLCIKRDDAVGPTITLENNANKAYINNWGSSGGGSGRLNRFEINATLQGQASFCAQYHTFMTGGVGDSNEKLRIGSAGQIGIAGANYGSSGQVLTSQGSGSAVSWTTITGTTINNNADNRLITGSGTANTLNGESNLTFDGSVLAVTGNIELPDDVSIKLGDQDDLQFTHSSGNVSIINSPTNRQLQLKGDGGLLIRASGNQNIANFVQSGCTLYHSVGNAYTARFTTTSTGITVVGEVAATQDYPLTKPVLDFNFAAEKKLDPRFQFTRQSIATFVDKKGIIQYASDNIPRFDHHPTSGVSLGLLLEREQTNYQEYSTLMSEANHKNNITVTDNFTISPDGTQNASKIVNATSNNAQTNIGWTASNVASGSYAMWSIWVKSEETSCILSFYSNTYIFGADRVNVELADGTYDGTSASSTFRFNIEKYPNKWWRISVGGNGQGAAGGWYVSVVDSKTAARGATCGSATNKTWFAWGVQEEISTLSRIATSYIPTNGAAVLRKGDRATIDGDDFDDFFDRFQGTVVNEHSNALQSIEGGGSGWEFNNDQLQVNLIAQTGSGYAHSHYPGCQASVFGDRNSGGSGGSGSPGTDYLQLYGPNSTIVNGGIQNGAANSGYGRYPGNTGGVPDYTRYYRTWIDAMSYDLTPSTNILRAATGGATTEGTNTQSISLANVSKFELGNDATDLLYSNFFGRIKRWMYFDKVLPLNQLGNLTAQLPNSYL